MGKGAKSGWQYVACAEGQDWDVSNSLARGAERVLEVNACVKGHSPCIFILTM